jgi:hypothetical protein
MTPRCDNGGQARGQKAKQQITRQAGVASLGCSGYRLAESASSIQLFSIFTTNNVWPQLRTSNDSIGRRPKDLPDAMSAARAVPRISAHNALTGLKIQARSAPPPPSFLLPGLASNWCQRRTFLTRRSTSFWTQSFPPQTVSSGNSAAFVPSVPPSPSSPPHEGARAESSRQGHERAAVDGKRKERKQRYLDSLMEKAGDLSLRCE